LEVRQGKDVKNKVLVAGASGLVGAAAIETFLAAGWDVIGISRRKPELPSGRDFRFIPVDLRDEKAARQALSPLVDMTHIAYSAIYENADDLVGGWSNSAQIETNDASPAGFLITGLAATAQKQSRERHHGGEGKENKKGD
jgi:NAD(P)-dependent dehydrogenase (short-subunit alcohol dehydrogenase family)